MYMFNHSNISNEKNAPKKKKREEKKEHLQAFTLSLFTNNENKNSKYIGTKV